jgi:hypothetical protein
MGLPMTYDSEPDTRAHIREVAARLATFAAELARRGERHDASKLSPEEKPVFDAVVPKLQGQVYGSPEYRAGSALLGDALRHHHARNSHHPEHYPDGIAGMDLVDLVEMYCDWAAATLRGPGGDLGRSIDINVERFAITPQLAAILRNTWSRHGGFEAALSPGADAG